MSWLFGRREPLDSAEDLVREVDAAVGAVSEAAGGGVDGGRSGEAQLRAALGVARVDAADVERESVGLSTLWFDDHEENFHLKFFELKNGLTAALVRVIRRNGARGNSSYRSYRSYRSYSAIATRWAPDYRMAAQKRSGGGASVVGGEDGESGETLGMFLLGSILPQIR